MTRHDAFIQKDWEKGGLASLAVWRTRSDGSVDYAIFIVDAYCLGVKDCVTETGVSATDVAADIDVQLPPAIRERIHPACAKKLIEGALAYAQALGFAPHRDFRKARKILNGIDAAACPREFTYGLDGKPCYVRGPEDDDDRVDRILAILEARCGEDGYDYVDPEEDEDELDDFKTREALMELLDAEPENVPRLYEVSGLIAAMSLCPTVLSPLKLLDVLWGPQGKQWKSHEEMQEFMNLLMSYWNQVNDLILSTIDPDAHPDNNIIDIFSEDFDEFAAEEGEETASRAMTAASIVWARGFLRATELWPEAWGNFLARPDLARHWEVIGWWAHFERKEVREKAIAAAESEPPHTLAAAANALARALRRPLPRAGESD
ncbi:MAG: YecA family protein [Opitutae bacterium]|nr:YecA family protein [Opitutae bacterium]